MITQQRNKQYAYGYLGLAVAFALTGIWQGQWLWYIFAVIIIALAGWRLHWLDKRLNN